MSRNPFLRYALSPLLTLITILAVEWTSNIYGFTATTALPITVLTLCIFWSGLKANILSAAFITLFAIHLFYLGDLARFIQIMLTVWPIAIFGGLLKRWLIESVLEAEYYRQKAIDNFNGNRAKMVEALDNLDKALEAKEVVDIKKYVQVARLKQADTLTLTSSWHEMAKDKRLAIEAIEESAGYPWRADEKIKNIDMVVHEILKEVYRLRRNVEEMRGIKDDD